MHPQIQAAIDAANAGDKTRALEIINQLFAQDSGNVEGWLMVAALTDDIERKVKYLYHVLSLDPQNKIAREELAEMKNPVPPQPAPTQAVTVQAARAAHEAGNKPRAMEYIKHIIANEPNNAQVWLLLADLTDSPEHKRHALQRALNIDPTNPAARQQLTELDRTTPAVPNPATTQTPAPHYAGQSVASTAQTAPAQKPALQVYKFSYPLLMRLITYGVLIGALIILFSGLAGQMGPYYWPLALVAVGGAWVASVRVEIDSSGVRVVQFFIRKEMKWDEIERIRTGVQRYHLQLFGSNGKSLKINSQIEGYDTLLTFIRQRRPDLFSEGGKTYSDYRVFKKSRVKYVAVVFGVILVLFGIPVLWAPTWGDCFGFLIFSAAGLYLIIAPLRGVRQIKVEPNILTLDWMFRNEEYRPHHIETIQLETLRNRYGAAHHYVVIKPQDEKPITLNDFGGDTDMLYGVLMNWWKSGTK